MKKILLLVIVALTLAISACGSGSANEPVPTVVLDGGTTNGAVTPSAPLASSNGAISASGTVVPVQDAQLAFALAGDVQKINVAEGDQVQAGDVLAELDNTSVQAEVDQAQRTLRELTSAAAVAAADQAVANAKKAYDDAQTRVTNISYRQNNQSDIDYYKAQLVLAQKTLDRARDASNKSNGLSTADPLRASATTNLYNAQRAYNTALSNLELFTTQPDATEVDLAKANLDSAAAALQEAQWYAAELKGETIPAEATGAQLTKLEQARDNLKTAQNRLDHTRLIAPFAGTITAINLVAGEYAAPGVPVIAISDVLNLQVVTTDLSERDVANVTVGQSATVFVEALNKEVSGKVLTISAVSDTLGGDVVYKTTVALDELPTGIRAGMSVTVQYQP